MARLSEKEWVALLGPRLAQALGACDGGGALRVEAGYRLPYAHEILRYGRRDPEEMHTARYETDLLVWEELPTGGWVPRVIVECKKGSVTTHDALTYSAKAVTHKQIHPYLRYGILIGDYGETVPARLIRHGTHFDFMTVWNAPDPSAHEWKEFIDLLMQEVAASRTLQALLCDRSKGHKAFRLIHRPLRVS